MLINIVIPRKAEPSKYLDSARNSGFPAFAGMTMTAPLCFSGLLDFSIIVI
jgi:hypothetical protein